MFSSEDYTLVWLGVSIALSPNEVVQAQDGVHPLMECAKNVGLDQWFDQFMPDPSGNGIYFLLLGEKVDILGYKEGRNHCLLSPGEVQQRSDRINDALREIGLAITSSLHIFLRIES